ERLEGDLASAEASAHEALAIALGAGARNMVLSALEVLAVISADLGSAEEAARLLGAAVVGREQTGWAHEVFGRSAQHATAAVRAAIGDVAFEALAQQGRALSLD